MKTIKLAIYCLLSIPFLNACESLESYVYTNSGAFIYDHNTGSLTSIKYSSISSPKEDEVFVTLHCGDEITIYHGFTLSGSSQPMDKGYVKIGDLSIVLDIKENYDLVLSEHSTLAAAPTSEASKTKHFETVAIADYKIPDIDPGRYMVTLSYPGASNNRKSFTYVNIQKNE